MKLTELFQNIADAIRSSHYDKQSKIKATDFPHEIQEACNNREMIGYDIGRSQGYNEGVQAEYDRFWDDFQFNGTRTNYNRTFYSWRAPILKPKYDLIPTRVDYMFMDAFPDYSGQGYSLVKALNDGGVILDTSQCTNFAYMFYYSYISEVGVIDTRGADSVNALFSWARMLKTIEKLILKSDGTQTLNNAFEQAIKLSDIIIEGTIGQSVSFQHSPHLTTTSLLSILTALSKDSSIANGKTVTFNTASQAVIEADSECSQQLALGVSAGWTVAYA